MTRHAVTFAGDLQQHRVFVAVDADPLDAEAVARRLALGPQRIARAAEERGVAGLACSRVGLLVHEADHQHVAAGRVLYDSRNEAVEFAEIHRLCPLNKKALPVRARLVITSIYLLQSRLHAAPPRRQMTMMMVVHAGRAERHWEKAYHRSRQSTATSKVP